WQAVPTSTPFGIGSTPAKSLTLIAVPIPNMITCTSGTISRLSWKSPTARNGPGRTIASDTAAKIHRVKLNCRSTPPARDPTASRMSDAASSGPAHAVAPATSATSSAAAQRPASNRQNFRRLCIEFVASSGEQELRITDYALLIESRRERSAADTYPLQPAPGPQFVIRNP